jgi:hypothetical protein
MKFTLPKQVPIRAFYPMLRKPGEGEIIRCPILVPASCLSARLSLTLWDLQSTQVANAQAVANIPNNPHFSVDIFRIKAYY